MTGLVIVIAKFKLPSYHVNDTIRFDFYAKGQLAQFVPQDFFFESAEWSGITLCVHFCCRQVLACSLPFSPWLLPSFFYYHTGVFDPDSFQILNFGLLYGFGGNKATRYPRIRKPIHLCWPWGIFIKNEKILGKKSHCAHSFSRKKSKEQKKRILHHQLKWA